MKTALPSKFKPSRYLAKLCEVTGGRPSTTNDTLISVSLQTSITMAELLGRVAHIGLSEIDGAMVRVPAGVRPADFAVVQDDRTDEAKLFIMREPNLRDELVQEGIRSLIFLSRI